MVPHGYMVPFTHPNAPCRVTVSGPTEKAVKAARDELEFITVGAMGTKDGIAGLKGGRISCGDMKM